MKNKVGIFGLLIFISVFNTGRVRLFAQNKFFSCAVRGTVVDRETGEPLPAANIMLLPLQRGTISDVMGRFEISRLAPGKHELRITFIGYQTFQDSVFLAVGKTQYFQIALAPQSIALSEISIEAAYYHAANEVNLSREIIDQAALRTTSSFSEPDLFRSLALLPGIAPANDYNTRLYVRGGRGNENQVLLDGVTIHNPYHAFGFMSLFDVEAIKLVEMYRGIFPPRYNQRLSSVTNVILRDGDGLKISGTGMVSPISAKIFLEGPILKYNSKTGQKWTWMFSARRTYLDLISKIVDILPFYFWDASFKTVYDSGEKNRILFHGFRSADRIKPDFNNGETDTYWQNDAGGLQWYHFFSPKNVLDFSLSYSAFKTSILRFQQNGWSTEKRTGQLNQIKEFQTRTEWNIDVFKTLHSTLGYQFSRFAIDEYLENIYSQVYQGEWRQNDHHQAWLNLEGRLGNLVIFEGGASALYFSYPNQYEFSPRIGLKWRLTDRCRLKAGYGRHFQALTTINDDDDAVVLFDAWIPSPQNRPIPQADHFGLGVEFIHLPRINLNAELYYRKYDDLTRINQSQLPGEPLFLDGWAESYGFDFGFQFKLSRFGGFINYTLGKATSHFFLRNVPMHSLSDFSWQTFPSAGDIRHILNAMVTTRLGSKWNFILSGVYQSGRPYTANLGNFFINLVAPPGAFYMEPGTPFLLTDESGYSTCLSGNSHYSSKNKYRFPFYQRIDIQFERNFRWQGLDWQLFLQIYNILCRLNTAFHYANSEVAYSVPILPTVGLQVQF